jgi:hypothetical protein
MNVQTVEVSEVAVQKSKKVNAGKIIRNEAEIVIEKYDKLIDIALQIGNLKSNQQLSFDDGVQLNKKDFKRMRNTLKTEAKAEIVKTMNDILKSSKSKKTGGHGFKCPIPIIENIVGFFNEGNFGRVDPSDPRSPSLMSELGLLTSGSLKDGSVVGNVTNRAILTPLFIIYTYVNNLQNDDNAQYIRADVLMRKYFTETFDAIRASGKGESADKCKYSTLQIIVKNNSGKLSDEDKKTVNETHEIKDELEREYQLVSACLSKWKELRKDIVDARKKRKQALKKSKQ